MKGKIFLDRIDDVIYSTESYAIAEAYRSIFYPLEKKETKRTDDLSIVAMGSIKIIGSMEKIEKIWRH